MSRPIGILGGSFDPVHFGHLRLATECLETAGLEKILLIPARTPPHRDPLIAGPEQRYDMLCAAVSSHRQLEVSDIEIRRDDVSYMIDTLRLLRNTYIDEPLCLIMGIDVFQAFDSWRDWENIPEFAHIIIANRANSKIELNNPRLKELLNSSLVGTREELMSSIAGKIFKVEIPLLEISSSKIRILISQGKSMDFLVPDKVIEYIMQNHIYTGNTQ